MQNLLKQSGGKDFVSFEKRFNNSLIALTAIYSITLGFILFISASISYSTFSFRVGARFDRVPPPEFVELHEIRFGPTVEEVREDLIESFIIVNGILFIFAVGVSYLLAKVTLNPLKNAYEEQRRFIADASHELKTPLAVMRIEMENELTDRGVKNKEKVESYLQEVDRMTKIVHSLLYLSKFENIQSTPEVSSINIQSSIDEIINRLHAFALSKKVKIHFNKSNELINIRGVEQISHVLSNIIQNAIVYNKEEGAVDVSVVVKKNLVHVLVKDTGIGISKENLQQVFNRFYRVDKSRSRATGGSGLGLSIAERIIKSIGGDIHIESELGKGTLVTMVFLKA